MNISVYSDIGFNQYWSNMISDKFVFQICLCLCYMGMDMDMDTDIDIGTVKAVEILRFRCWILDIGKQFNLISDIMSGFTLFSPVSELPISGSVRYHSSWISDCMLTHSSNRLQGGMYCSCSTCSYLFSHTLHESNCIQHFKYRVLKFYMNDFYFSYRC
jgi:hypothetical protein